MVETTEPRDAEVARIAAIIGPLRNDLYDWLHRDSNIDQRTAAALYDAGLRSTSRDSEPTTVLHEDGPEHERWEPCTLPADHRHRCRTIEPKPTSRDAG